MKCLSVHSISSIGILFEILKMRWTHNIILIVVLFVVVLPKTESFIVRLITETLQNNVAGEPITHERTEWDFDPDASQKRRALFYETHGFRAAKYIERIGLGLDGLEQDRRIEQQTRDQGRLNGEHNINFPSLA